MNVRDFWVRRAAAGRAAAKHRHVSRAVGAAVTLTAIAGVAAASAWPAQSRLAAAGRSSGQAAPAWVAKLSAGAPPGALTLSSSPVMVAKPAPATPAVISGLAADGIPNVALNAYRVAADRIDTALAGCGIDWSLIAAIGRVESDHGQFGGATLATDGTSTPKIIGPALNGVGFAYIGDTDHGVYDQDVVYDRAVGPMQFIPSTWASYALDANGDGSASPFDINDTALAAGHYLCVAGGDLRTAAGQQRAVLAYNHSNQYLAMVLALARGYATGVVVAGVPVVGSTSGSVPAPSGDAGAPAAPGPAPAAAPSSGRGQGKPAARHPAPSRPAPGGVRTPAGGTKPQPQTTPAPAGPVPAPPGGAPVRPGPVPTPTTLVPTGVPPLVPGPAATPKDPTTCLLVPALCPPG